MRGIAEVLDYDTCVASGRCPSEMMPYHYKQTNKQCCLPRSCVLLTRFIPVPQHAKFIMNILQNPLSRPGPLASFSSLALLGAGDPPLGRGNLHPDCDVLRGRHEGSIGVRHQVRHLIRQDSVLAVRVLQDTGLDGGQRAQDQQTYLIVLEAGVGAGGGRAVCLLPGLAQ